MESREKNNIIFIRLFKNEDVNDMLKKVCLEHNLKTGVIISGIGQIKNSRLGYFKKKGDYLPQDFNKPLELLSLSGNIVKDNNEHILHIHAILGDEEKNTIGGHLIKAEVSVTGEIVILKTGINAKRTIDEKTGLKSLTI